MEPNEVWVSSGNSAGNEEMNVNSEVTQVRIQVTSLLLIKLQSLGYVISLPCHSFLTNGLMKGMMSHHAQALEECASGGQSVGA